MGMGHRGSRIVAAVVVAGLVAAPASAKTNYHAGVWNLLRAGGLCFAENGDSKAWRAGTIDAGGKRYEIWGYSWEETPRTKTGSTEHANFRILVFERAEKQLSYLGNYNVDSVPFAIQGRAIKFDYAHGDPGAVHYPGDKIEFDDNGPPRQIVLDGELHSFDPATGKVCTFR